MTNVAPGTVPPQFTGVDPDQVADPRVRSLLDRYVSISGANLEQVGADIFELRVPAADRDVFDKRATIRIALSVEALEMEPDAEMAVVGSAFVERLIGAIRKRGARLVVGDVPPSMPETAAAATLEVPVVNGATGRPTIRLARHPVGRLRARVTVRAGTSVNEYLIESSIFDLSTGIPLTDDIASACAARAPSGASSAMADVDTVTRVAAKPVDELVTMMLGDLERRLAPDVERQSLESRRMLEFELARIDRYYTGMLEDIGGRATAIPDAASRRAIEAEHARRRSEEIRRHDVRATVHPVQLTEWTIPVQHAEWPLTSTDGHASTVSGLRALVGGGKWQLGCAHCGSAGPTALVVCKNNHTACAACGATCSVCNTGFCLDHGVTACHIDGKPACDSHSRECPSCQQAHCSQHQAVCYDGDHVACSACVSPCAHCGRQVCEAHAVTTAEGAPLGTRRICANCVCYCEGGSNEPVGVDEVVRCASCERFVCQRHQAICAVDGKVHCSRHLRRADRSRRLICEHDRAQCEFEPHAIFAKDEVFACSTCGKVGCSEHSGVCVEDGARHCQSHLVQLTDRRGAMACESHHSTCHVDRKAVSLGGTRECPVCARHACVSHTLACSSCARQVCTTDIASGPKPVCKTCAALDEITDPSDDVLHAAVAVRGDSGMPKRWRQARDAGHNVVEMDFGWTRRVVFTLRHGEQRADSVVRHSLLGSTVTKEASRR